MSLFIKRNTYPEYEGVAHARDGDKVYWMAHPGRMDLVRFSDSRTVFSTSGLDANGKKPNGEYPPTRDVVAQVKSKGWVLEVEER